MAEARYFLAHRRQDDDQDIDDWTAALMQRLSVTGWTTRVVPGRDDFKKRAAAVGGWKSWVRDVACGCNFRGDPMFHGVVVPMDAESDHPTVGKATAELIRGFISEGKYVYTWCPRTDALRSVLNLVDTGRDDWKGWSILEFTNP